VEKLDVPLMRQPAGKPLVKLIVLGAGTCPQATVIASGATMRGNAAGRKLITCDAVDVFPQASVAVHVLVML
jgi:hypothetical protein